MLAPDTLVTTLHGPRILLDIVDAGPEYVVTWDGERITVGQIVVERSSNLVIPWSICLDDDSRFVCCRETMIITLSGAPRFPEQLEPDTSLLPLYMKLDGAGYPIYREPGEWHLGALTSSDRNRWRRLGRMVAEWKLGRRCGPGDEVSYLTGDRSNCQPSNLLIKQRPRKQSEQKVDFVEPLVKAQKFIRRHNHKLRSVTLDKSCNLLSIRGLGINNLAVSGVFVSTDVG